MPPTEAPAPDRPPEVSAGPIVDPGAGTCPRCGAEYASLQEYCLECGLRLPLVRGVVSSLQGAWTRRLRWYPGDWIWPVLLALMIAALGAGVAILANEREAAGTLVATTEPGEVAPPTTETGSTATTETDTATTETAATTEPPPPPPPPPPAGPVEWPATRRGYTVVLASIPTTAGRQSATRQVERALDGGLTDVGVLTSSEYSSLHPGYFVVFAGIFDSLSAAEDAIPGARAGGFSGAYARQIVP